jgi:hypothetical protein
MTEFPDILQFCVQEGWSVLCGSGVTAPGELICVFMKRIGLADHVIVLQPSWNNKVG